MILKLSPESARALFVIFNEVVLVNPPVGMDEKLIMLHMVSIYKKLRAKWEGEPAIKYKLKISVEEALAYRIYWRDSDLQIGGYELNMIRAHCIQIDEELSNLQRINYKTNFLTQ